MNISKEFILSVAINSSAVKNGSDLVKKKSFEKLSIDADKTLIFGECVGSGSKPYICSVDFINEANPVYRCTCPSRQIPCKHVLGLMWAYAEGMPFSEETVPEDIALKRLNMEKRLEKQKETKSVQTKPKEKSDSWKKTAIKKIDAQISGICEAEKLLNNIVQTGLGAIDLKTVNEYAGIVKQLDSYYINGIQNECNNLLELLKLKEHSNNNKAVVKICELQSLLSKSKLYLENKKKAPDVIDIETEIEELIGYPWKLEELKQYGLIEENARLVQLAFHVLQEDDKKQFVDEAFYISLNSGKVYKTRNYRPYKALKHIKEEDSIHSFIDVPELFIYPSISLNPRVRWDFGNLKPIEKEVYMEIKSKASPNFSEVIKLVKNQLKNLMLNRYPVVLVKFDKLFKVDGEKNQFVMKDTFDNQIYLKKSKYISEDFIYILDNVKEEFASLNAMLIMFHNDVESGILAAHPLALITNNKIIKLVF